MESIINEIKECAKKYPEIKKVILFGSRARGDNRPKSDIDIAIEGEGDFCEFVFDLETEVRTLLEFDVTIIKDGLDENFLKQVQNEGITIYEKS